jgi:hypothetical protein
MTEGVVADFAGIVLVLEIVRWRVYEPMNK